MSADHPAGPGTFPSLNAERALHCCLLAFGRPGSRQSEDSPWSWLEPGWRGRMAMAEEGFPTVEPEAALRALQHSHRVQAGVDRERVHPSWLDRAVLDESPAVRRSLARHDLDPDVDPEIAAWVRALATERLVGGEPANRLDSPVIMALGGLSLRSGLRLADAAGRAKLALADEASPAFPDERPGRPGWSRQRLVARLGGDEEQLRKWARRELHRAEQAETRPSRIRAYLGLTTMARLLTACEPFRVRWALQHVPYPVAKRFRAIISSPGQSHPVLLQIEDVLLRTAWERLALDGRVPLPDPDPIARPDHAP